MRLISERKKGKSEGKHKSKNKKYIGHAELLLTPVQGYNLCVHVITNLCPQTAGSFQTKVNG